MDTWTVLVTHEPTNQARMFSVKAFTIVDAAEAAQAIAREHFTVVQITRE